MDEQDTQERNMISNLPLLFANGYPTSLDKITEKQLENFIPFMVQCSLGQINLIERGESSEPEWWPEDVPFTIPLTKPKKFSGKWMDKMKEIVLICYQFHKSVFLLRFCNDLSSYEHACLRFINNYNSTTSLFERRSNKLLVTFRNENMSYDQPQRGRKCLMQPKSKSHMPQQGMQQMMVEPAPFDIYLCDNCDAELYSREAILEHEKTCQIDDDDDDVILCDSPEPTDISDANPSKQQQTNLDGGAAQDHESRNCFLLNFNLQHRDVAKLKKPEASTQATDGHGLGGGEHGEHGEKETKKRRPPRNRQVHMMTRSHIIPISSPAGQRLQRITKTYTTSEYLEERFDRLERFCQAAPLHNSSRPKYFERRTTGSNPHCTFKKSQEYSSHLYVFPRRQYAQSRRAESVLFLNSALLRRCRPISVRLKKITEQDVRGRHDHHPHQHRHHHRSMSMSASTSSTNHKLNIRLKRDASQSSSWKISSAASSTARNEIIVDTIDLCSSDEEADSLTNGHGGGELVRMSEVNTSTKSVIITGPVNNNSMTLNQFKSLNYQHLLAKPEISLIPIRKALSNCSIQCESLRKSPSVGKTAGSSAASEKSTNSQYDSGVVVASTSPPATPDSIMENGPKPLRPSVFILSNINRSASSMLATATESVAASATATANPPSFTNHNQENLNNSTTTTAAAIGNSFANKHTNNNNSSADWYPEGSGAPPPSPANRSSQGGRNGVVQSFGSPNCVISIDLTS